MTNEYLEGKKWGELTKAEQNELLTTGHAVDNMCNNMNNSSGECIVDFEGLDVSISGYFEVGEFENSIIIDDNSIFYNPTNKFKGVLHMLNLKGMVTLFDDEKTYILERQEAEQLEKEEPYRFTISEENFEKWKFIGEEENKTGYIEYKYLDENKDERIIVENKWTSGSSKISHLTLE